jgi:Kelch motif/TIR domain/Galactose oxidase, central domain
MPAPSIRYHRVLQDALLGCAPLRSWRMRLPRGGGAQCAAPFPCRKPAVLSCSRWASPRRGVSSCSVGLVAESAGPSPGRVFISYRREETAYAAGWLYDRLADSFGGGQVFKDIDSIELGDDFVEVVTRAVGSCDVLLAIIGDHWLTVTGENGRRRLDDPDDFVRLEIEAALTRNVRVIPILVNEARMPRANELPPSLSRLARRQALELSPARFEYDTSRLLRVLDRTLAEMRTAHEDAASDQLKPADRSMRQQQLADWDSEAHQAAEDGRWAVAVAALERIAAAQPDHPDIAQRLEQARTQQQITGLQADLRNMSAERQWTAVIAIGAQLAGLDPQLADLDGLVSAARDQLQRQQQLADWDSEAHQAAEQGQWAVAVAALERIANAQPDHPDIAPRLEQARTQQKITSLQADLRRKSAEQQWTAVITIDEQLARLDPTLADLDGLVSAARDQLQRQEQAPSPIEEHAEAPTERMDPAAAQIPPAPSPDAPAQPERRWLVPAIIAVAGVIAVVVAVAVFRPPDGSGTEGSPTFEPSPSSPSPSSPTPLAWRSIEPGLSAPLDWPGVVALDDKLWVVGGLQGPGNEAVNTVEVYDPKQDKWERGPELPVRLEHAAVATDNRTLYVIGGKNEKNVVQNKVYMLAENRQTWTELASLPVKRYAGAAAWDGQRLVFAGGMEEPERQGVVPPLPSPDVYVLESPEDNDWVKLGELKDGRHHLAAASDGQGQVWFIGGRGGPEGTTVFGSDIVKDDSIKAEPAVDPVHAPAAVWRPNTGVCVLGGAKWVEDDWDATNAVTCGWPKLLEDRAGAGAAIVDDTVYLVGGYGDDKVYTADVSALKLG